VRSFGLGDEGARWAWSTLSASWNRLLARTAIRNDIHQLYNHQKQDSAIGQCSPVPFESNHRALKREAALRLGAVIIVARSQGAHVAFPRKQKGTSMFTFSTIPTDKQKGEDGLTTDFGFATVLKQDNHGIGAWTAHG
jgi:hypothetical protein